MKPLWAGSLSPVLDKVQLGLQTRWPDTQVTSVADLAQAMGLFLTAEFDAVFLHLEGEQGGCPFIQDLRQVSDIPLFAVHDGVSSLAAVKALHAGADGVIYENHGPLEIQAMLMALLRRLQGKNSSREQVIQLGRLRICNASHEVYLGGTPLHLTPTEFRVLYALAQRRGMVATQESLVRSIWGEEADGNVLRKYIQRLRAKFKEIKGDASLIVTVPAVGYRLVAEQDDYEAASPKGATAGDPLTLSQDQEEEVLRCAGN